jgi:hypothetical protein
MTDRERRVREVAYSIWESEGRQPNHLIALGIARFIAHERAAREELESAKRAAEVRFGVSERPIDRAWA